MFHLHEVLDGLIFESLAFLEIGTNYARAFTDLAVRSLLALKLHRIKRYTKTFTNSTLQFFKRRVPKKNQF